MSTLISMESDDFMITQTKVIQRDIGRIPIIMERSDVLEN